MTTNDTSVICMMMGVGSRTFITDWAKAVSSFAHVIGVRTDRVPGMDDLPVIGRRLYTDDSDGLTVVIAPSRKLRPGRVFAPINHMFQTQAIMRASRWIKENKGDPNVIHSHFAAASGGVPAAARRLGLPYIHTEHTSNAVWKAGSRTPAWVRNLVKVIRRAEAVIVVSEDLRQGMEHLGLGEDLIVVGNPVDGAEFAPSPDQTDQPQLVNVGSLIPRKRVGLLLEAFAGVAQVKPTATLVVIGEGSQAEDLKKTAEQTGLADHVSFMGKLSRSELAKIMAESHVYVHTSEAETFGVSIVEAQLAGLPVVTTNCGGVVGDHPNPHMTVVGDDPNLIASGVLDVLDQAHTHDDRRQIARSARSLWSFQGVAADVEAIYARTVRRSR